MSDKLQETLQQIEQLNGAEKAQLQDELISDFELSTPEDSEFEQNDEFEKLSYKNMYPTTPSYVPFDIETTGLNIQDKVISVGFIFGNTMHLHAVAKGFTQYNLRKSLTSTKGIGTSTCCTLLSSFDTPTDILTASQDQLTTINGIGENRAQKIQQATEQYIDSIADELTETMRTHDEVDDLTVELTLSENEEELLVNMKNDIEDNFINDLSVLSTYNGYTRHGGFDYKMLEQAASFSEKFSEHPLRGCGHVDLKEYLDNRDVINTRVKELSANSLTSTFNASELYKVVDRLQEAYVDSVTSEVRDFVKRYKQILSEMDTDDKFSEKAVQMTLDTFESSLSDAQLAGAVIPDWSGGSRKKDTERRLKLLEKFDTLNLDAVIEEMDEYCRNNDVDFPNNTRSTLDGIYHCRKTRGNDKADTIDPLDEDSSRVPVAYENGEIQDVLLHLADDLIKTRFATEELRKSCPSDTFYVDVL